MPITIAQMATDVAQVSLEYAGQTVNISYSPSSLTEKVYADMQEWGNKAPDDIVKNLEALNNVIVAMVKDWDVYEDEAQTTKVPIDAEHLSMLPIFFRAAVLGAIAEHFSPNATAVPTLATVPPSSVSLSSDSPQPPPESPNGIPSSALPATSE